MINLTKQKLIKRILELCYSNKEGHIPSSLSVLDILYSIYKNKTDHDRFVLSKGHASLGLYVILENFGLLQEDLNTFCKFNSIFGGHPTIKISNVEASTGSLGHGMPMALGMAIAKKIKNEDGNIYVLIGDGECNEGTIWETALLAHHHKLNNLYCLLDHNHSTDRALDIGNVLAKFQSFGWDCIEIDGHSTEDIKKAIQIKSNKPVFILCNTIKGKDCSVMENNPEWHHKIPSEEQYINIINKL